MTNTLTKSVWLVALSLTACTTGSSASGDELHVIPDVIYTGFDGTNTYKAPIIAALGTAPAAGATWTLADPSYATMAPNADGTNMLVTERAGTTQLTVSVGGHTATARLVITSYTPATHVAGEKRYMTGEGGDPACVTCHATGPDHTPTQIVVDSDDQVAASFVNGVDPEGVPIPAAKHKFAVTEPEKLGLVSYLRALEPKGYPDPEEP